MKDTFKYIEERETIEESMERFKMLSDKLAKKLVECNRTIDSYITGDYDRHECNKDMSRIFGDVLDCETKIKSDLVTATNSIKEVLAELYQEGA